MDDDQIHFGAAQLVTLRPVIHILGMGITGHKVYNGQHQNVSRHLQTHLEWANGAVREKRSRQHKSTASNVDPLLV